MIILMGKPGAGKGTQADLLTQGEVYASVNPGGLLRAAAKDDPSIAATMNAGKLVEPEIIYRLIEASFNRYGKQRIILDNFPRNQEQARWLKAHLDKNPPEKIELIILDISDDEVFRRLAKRGRPDDNESAIRTRLGLFNNEVQKAISLLSDVLTPVKVDALGSVEEVHDRLIKALQS